MKKIILLLIILLLVFIYAYYNQSIEKDLKPIVHKKELLEPIKQHTTDNNKTISIKKRPTKKIKYKTNVYNLFEEADMDFVALKMKKLPNTEPIMAIQMKQNKIKNMHIGDTVILPNINGLTYKLKIGTDTISKRGNTSVSGKFTDNGISYSAIITEGKTSAFISMNTPEGTYEIELMNGIGFIYQSADMDKGMIDYSKSDMIHSHE